MPPRKPRTAEDVAAQQGLGLAVRRLRRDRGWSQVTLGERAGLSADGIGKLERGEQEPTWGNLRRVANGLGVPVADLNRLAIERAPGQEGDRLREAEAEMLPAKQT